MTDPLRDFAAREAQHEPHPRVITCGVHGAQPLRLTHPRLGLWECAACAGRPFTATITTSPEITPRPALTMRRCPDCGRLHEVTGDERVCEDCAEAELRSRSDWARLDWPSVGRGE